LATCEIVSLLWLLEDIGVIIAQSKTYVLW